MMKKIFILSFISFISFFLFSETSILFAQEPKEVIRPDKEASLLLVIKSIEALEQDISEKQLQLQTPQAGGRKEELSEDIQNAVRQVDELRKNLDEIATEVDFSRLSKETDDTNYSWNTELKDLLSPLINELKEITRRPREFDALKKEISNKTDRLAVLEKGSENFDKILSKTKDKKIISYLSKSKEKWEADKQNIKTALGILEQKLSKREAEKKPFFESIQRIFQMFFRSRGKNFLISISAAFLFLFLIRRLKLVILRPVLREGDEKNFAYRITQILYYVLSITGSITVFLVALYFFEDWVLLILAVMLLLGLVWASKEAIPKFWAQGTLLVNLGPVRENERVEQNGLPWFVKSINFYSILENPLLEGGSIRIPVQDLYLLRSRPFSANESWFPTCKDDWVLLADGTYGQIRLQTPEIVEIKLPGNSIMTLKVADFLASNPQNLSHGFRITTSFGIDYQHQNLITENIPNKFQEMISKSLTDKNLFQKLTNFSVEFESAAASSLNIAVITDFSGEVANQYKVLTRLIPKICVECCNQESWIIPFQQITVHMNK